MKMIQMLIYIWLYCTCPMRDFLGFYVLAIREAFKKVLSCLGVRLYLAIPATSSQNQVMTYPYYVRILNPSPPTIYHGQGLA